MTRPRHRPARPTSPGRPTRPGPRAGSAAARSSAAPTPTTAVPGCSTGRHGGHYGLITPVADATCGAGITSAPR